MNYAYLPYDAEIRRLKSDLYCARSTIVDLMPDQMQSALRSYYSCDTREQSYKWRHDAVAKAVEIAVPLSRDEGSYFSPRAYCPLCRQGTSGPYESGFSLPEGLSRHLEGHGRVSRCPVMEAAMALAHDYFEEKFGPKEQAEREELEKEIERRKAVELLYRINVGAPPVLIDESLGYGGEPRTEEELIWAEQRLSELGFQPLVADRVKQYVLDRHQVAVFADPRAKGEISFRVYKKPLPKRGHGKLQRTFSLKDGWKNDIKGKFEARVGDASPQSEG